MPRHRLLAGDAALAVDPADGGRWTSLQVDGLELLSGADIEGVPPRARSGCFPMAPFAGRLRNGELVFRGRTYHLPQNAPPHAIHGTAVDGDWTVVDEEPDGDVARLVIQVALAPPWPFAGTVRQELTLRPDRLDARLVLSADEDMPATLGYHPWFARRLGRGQDLRLELEPVQQYVRGADGLPTGELAPPGEGPYDDCFLGTTSPARLVWPDALGLTVTSSHDHWVVFDERPDVLCLEPQTGPPDAPTLGRADVVAAGEDLALEVSLRWSR